MNFLEELDLPALNTQEEAMIAGQIAPLLPQLELINRDAQTAAKLVQDSTPVNQLAIIDELFNFNKQKLEENNKMLHDNISKEAEIRIAMQKIETGEVLHGNPEELKSLQHELKVTHEKIVNLVEEIDFTAIAKIKGLRKNQAEQSFHKLFMFVLELFYGFPSSKYYWPEFRVKAFLKDKGNELKRRIIKPLKIFISIAKLLINLINSRKKVLRIWM